MWTMAVTTAASMTYMYIARGLGTYQPLHPTLGGDGAGGVGGGGGGGGSGNPAQFGSKPSPAAQGRQMLL